MRRSGAPRSRRWHDHTYSLHGCHMAAATCCHHPCGCACASGDVRGEGERERGLRDCNAMTVSSRCCTTFTNPPYWRVETGARACGLLGSTRMRALVDASSSTASYRRLGPAPRGSARRCASPVGACRRSSARAPPPPQTRQRDRQCQLRRGGREGLGT